jgi:hypothetical protein
MTRKRTLLVLLVVAGLGGVAAVAYLATSEPEPGVTMANFDRVTMGMSRRRVEGIFGGPGKLMSIDPTGKTYEWTNGDVRIIVPFSIDDDVVVGGVADDGEKFSTIELPPSLLNRIKALLHL